MTLPIYKYEKESHTKKEIEFYMEFINDFMCFFLTISDKSNEGFNLVFF